MPVPFESRRAPAYRDVPDEQWNNWRWQLSHRLNSAEEIGAIIELTDSERH
jgi:lysine 2,3-aminomutase